MFAMGHPIVFLLFAVVAIVPFWKIYSRAGFPGWIAIGMLVPLLNLVLLFYVAFAEWPRDRAELKAPGAV